MLNDGGKWIYKNSDNFILIICGKNNYICISVVCVTVYQHYHNNQLKIKNTPRKGEKHNYQIVIKRSL